MIAKLAKSPLTKNYAYIPKKPGFLPNLRVTTKYSRKNPVSEHLARESYLLANDRIL